MKKKHELSEAVSQLPSFVAYVLKNYWHSRLVFVLAIVLLIFEYAAFSLMLPISGGSSQSKGAVAVLFFWDGVADAMDLPKNQMTWIWLFLLLLAARLVLGFFHLLITNWVSKLVHRHLSEKTFRRVLLAEPMAEIYRRSIGYYISLAGDDTFRAGTIINTVSQALVAFTSVIAGFVLLCFFSPMALAGTSAFLVGCGALVVWAFRKLMRSNSRSVNLSREAGTTYIEALNGLRSIRSMKAETFVLENYVDQIGRYVRLLFENDALKNGVKFLPAILALLVGVFALWPGNTSVNLLTASFIFAIITLLIRIFVSLGTLVNYLSVLLMDLRALRDIRELTGSNDLISNQQIRRKSERISTIELSNICCGYGSGELVINNLSYRFNIGNTYAIVGPSGSGKSTLADLLLGLISPESGEILVNGVAVTDNTTDLNVILVEQQVRIFSGTVRENLTMGLDCADDLLWQMLTLVNLGDFVRSLPQGLDSQLDYQGANVSGGQRQRLGIARALLRKPDVLILDEATSALDYVARIEIVQNLRHNMREGIIIFITHDAEIAALADEVLTIDKEVHR